MSPDEEFVRDRHPDADLVEVVHPTTGHSRWCIHYHAELDSKVIGEGDSIEEAWANARAICTADPIIA